MNFAKLIFQYLCFSILIFLFLGKLEGANGCEVAGVNSLESHPTQFIGDIGEINQNGHFKDPHAIYNALESFSAQSGMVSGIIIEDLFKKDVSALIEWKNETHCLKNCYKKKILCGDVAGLILKKWGDLLDKEYLEQIFKKSINLYEARNTLSKNGYKLALKILNQKPDVLSPLLIQKTLKKYSKMCLKNLYGKIYTNNLSFEENQNPRALVFLILNKRGAEIPNEQIETLYKYSFRDRKLEKIILDYLEESGRGRQLTLKTFQMPKKQKNCGCSVF